MADEQIIDQQQQIDPVEKLYNTLHDKGYYTKSLQDFKTKYNNPQEIDKLYSVVNRDGLYTKTRDDFSSQYFAPSQKKSQVGGNWGALFQYYNSPSNGSASKEVKAPVQVSVASPIMGSKAAQAGEEVVKKDPAKFILDNIKDHTKKLMLSSPWSHWPEIKQLDNAVNDVHENLFPNSQTAYDYLQKHGIDKDNETSKIALSVVHNKEAVLNALGHSPGTIKGAALNFFENVNGKLDRDKVTPELEGEIVKSFLSNKALKELPNSDPRKLQINNETQNFYNSYPELRNKMILEKIGDAREKYNKNNWFLNLPGTKSSDKLVDKMVADGDLSPVDRNFYNDVTRKMIAIHAVDIPTPGLVESAVKSFGKTVTDVPKGVYQLTGLRKLLHSNEDIRTQDLSEQAGDVREPEYKGVMNNLFHATGNLLGMAGPIGLEGKALKGLGIVGKAGTADALATGLTFYNDIQKQENINHPNNPLLSHLSALLQTAGWMYTGKVFGGISKGFTKEVAPEVNSVLKSLEKGEIDNALASKSIAKTIIDGASKVAGESMSSSAKVAGIAALNSSISNILNGKFDLDESLQEGAKTFGSMMLGLPLLNIAKVAGAKNMTADYLDEIIKSPELQQKITDPEQQKNLQHLMEVHNQVEAMEDLKPEQKKKLQLVELQKKILQDKVSAAPSKALSEKDEKQIAELEIEGKKILAPDMGNKKLIEEFYDNDLLDKGSKMLLEDEKGKFSEHKVGDYLKQIAQQANGLDENWKPLEHGKPTMEGVPQQVIDAANERWKKEIPQDEEIKSHVPLPENKNEELDNEVGELEYEAIKDQDTFALKYFNEEEYKKWEEIKGTNEGDSMIENKWAEEEQAIRDKHKTTTPNENITEENKPDQQGNISTEESIPATGTTDKNSEPAEEKTGEAKLTIEGNEPPPNTPVEATEGTDESNTVGIRHESLKKIADRLGLKQPERGTFLTPEEQTKRGRLLLQGGADPLKVAADFEEHGTANADAISVARAHWENLVKEADAAKDKFGKNSEEFAKAKKEMQAWQDEVLKPMGTSAGASFSALQGENDLDTGSFIALSEAFKEKYGKEPNAKQEKTIQELSDKVKGLTNDFEDLKAKLTEALDKSENPENKSFKEKSKNLAASIRKLKTKKPDTFSAATPASLLWDAAVEIVAKTIEAGGEIADAVSKGVAHIKESDWYKGLSQDKKDKAEKSFTDSMPKSKEQKRIEALEKRLKDLQEGNIKPGKEKREPSQREKDLMEAIKKEKEDLGLNEKVKPPKGVEKKEESEHFYDLVTKFTDKKDNKFAPEDAKDIWNYAKTTYLDKGASFDEMISKTATDLGLKPTQVRDALITPKGARSITDAMYKKQNERNMAIQRAKDWVNASNKSGLSKFLGAIPRFFFAEKVFGHGTVGMVTHSGINIYDPVEWKRYWPIFFKQFKFAYGKTADYEKAMQDLQNDPQYIFWKRNGLAVDPTARYDDFQFISKVFQRIERGSKFKMGGKEFAPGRALTAGDRGFNALKVYRLERAKGLWKGLSESEKADKDTPELIAKLVNHSTGTTNLKVSNAANVAFFAPNLELSRWNKLIVDPAKAIATFTNWDKSTPAERAAAKIVARRAGRILGFYLSALATNDGLLMLSGSNQRVNFFNPMQSDWLKFKIGGRTIDMTGGMISILGFIVRMAHTATANSKDIKGRSRKDALMGQVWDYGSGKASPFAGTVKDVVTHHDFQGNTLPLFNDKPLHSWNHKLTLGEYLKKQQTPIPVAEYFTDLDKQMQDAGMNRPTIGKVLQSIFVASMVGGTGVHIGEEPRKPSIAFSDEDKKDPTFKYFLDKGLELPNTVATSEEITDEEKGTKKKLSDYSKDIQDNYMDRHKAYLKEELQRVIDNKSVYVKEYVDADGVPKNSVKIENPNEEGYEEKVLSKLTKDELVKILHIAQSSATKKTKKELFQQ